MRAGSKKQSRHDGATSSVRSAKLRAEYWKRSWKRSPSNDRQRGCAAVQTWTNSDHPSLLPQFTGLATNRLRSRELAPGPGPSEYTSVPEIASAAAEAVAAIVLRRARMEAAG
jgi:hypothetical protein